MIRVLIADDQKLVRQGLQVLLARALDIEIVGQAHDGQEAVDLTRELAPDVVLMDVRMPRLNGLAATEQIAAQGSKTRILMVAMQCDEHTVRQALRVGAQGFMEKSQVYTELAAAVRAVAAGKSYYTRSIGEMLSGT